MSEHGVGRLAPATARAPIGAATIWVRAAGLPLLRLFSAGISFELGLARSLSGLKLLVVRTTCDGCLVTEAINDPLMPLLGSIASCAIKVDRHS